jgi:hypothetical protein
MFHANSVTFHAARRLAAIGALAIGFAGAAHASYDLTSPTFLAYGNDAEFVVPTQFANTALAAPVLGNLTGTYEATYLGSSAPAIASGNTAKAAEGSTGGFGSKNHAFGPPPAPTPEPITMGLSLFGLAIAARRVRQRTK